jgi:hypothetical protein
MPSTPLYEKCGILGFGRKEGHCPPQVTCGPHTTLTNGVCEAATTPQVTCGPHTTLTNGVCEAATTPQVTCGPHTTLTNGVCEVNTMRAVASNNQISRRAGTYQEGKVDMMANMVLMDNNPGLLNAIGQGRVSQQNFDAYKACVNTKLTEHTAENQRAIQDGIKPFADLNTSLTATFLMGMTSVGCRATHNLYFPQ